MGQPHGSLHGLVTAHFIQGPTSLVWKQEPGPLSWLCLSRGPRPHSCKLPVTGAKKMGLLKLGVLQGTQGQGALSLSRCPHPVVPGMRFSPRKALSIRGSPEVNRLESLPLGCRTPGVPSPPHPLLAPAAPQGWEFPNCQRQGRIERPPPPVLGQWGLMPSKSEQG